MKLASQWREWFLTPLLLFGYMETLRRATFQSFGLASQGSAFTVLTILITIAVVLEFYTHRRWIKIGHNIFTACYILAALSNNYFIQGKTTGLPNTLWSFPSLQSSSSGLGHGEFIFLFIFIFYAILLYLVINYVLERKDITELTAASAFLLAVEIASSQRDLSQLVIAHIVLVLLLRSQVFYLYLASHREFKAAKRPFGHGWVGTNLLVTAVVIVIALAIPTDGKGIAVTAQPVKWVKGKVMDAASSLTPNPRVKMESPEGDSFQIYWGRLQTFRLKGTVQNSDSMVMSVKAARPFYWRGESADFYTGSGWANSFEMDTNNNNTTKLPNPYGRHIPVQRLEQTFTIAPGLTSTVVFTGSAPESIEVPGGVFWSDEAGNYYTNEMKSGVTYRVTSYIPEFSVKQLKKAKINSTAEIEQYYLQLPDDLPMRVKDKALAITNGYIYPYDKAKAIERYLSSNYPYTLEVDCPEGNKDIVDHFLFDLKKGYCTYHSTAMVVMLRTIGIPARWVKGFSSGTYDAATGTYVVKETDAHAWVEVYFGDYGWIPFEPTSTFQLPAVQTEPESVALDLPDDTASGRNTLVSAGENGENSLVRKMSFVVYTFVFGITTVVVISTWLGMRFVLKSLEIGRARDFYLDMLYLLENKGISRTFDQTPYEFANALGGRFPTVQKEILLLTEGYLREQYGNHKLTKQEQNLFEKAWLAIVAALKEGSRES